MKEPIHKVTLKDGTVRYRLVVDVGRDTNGKRLQLTRTFNTQRKPATSCPVSATKRTSGHTSGRRRKR